MFNNESSRLTTDCGEEEDDGFGKMPRYFTFFLQLYKTKYSFLTALPSHPLPSASDPCPARRVTLTGWLGLCCLRRFESPCEFVSVDIKQLPSSISPSIAAISSLAAQQTPASIQIFPAWQFSTTATPNINVVFRCPNRFRGHRPSGVNFQHLAVNPFLLFTHLRKSNSALQMSQTPAGTATWRGRGAGPQGELN
jgi:hypothetical protein